MGRIRALGASVVVLCTLGVSFASPALAGSGDLIGTVDEITDPIDKALDKANQTSDETTDKVDQTTDRITDEVDDATGGNQGDEVDGVVSDTTRTIDENVNQVTGPNGPVRETKRVLLDAIEEVLGGGNPTIRNGGVDGFITGNGKSLQDGPGEEASSGEPLGGVLRALVVTATTEVNTATTSSPQADGTSLAEQIERAIQGLIQAAAFPLILALLIGAFLLIQNRIDSQDPKMLLSVIEPEQNYLTFR